MKKFFIVLCGILIMGNAFGAVQDEAKLSSFSADWNVGPTYDVLPNPGSEKNMYDRDYSQFGKDEIKGTYGNDEGAIVALIAQKIYKNGAKICTTQIQAANANWTASIWIDYHFNENEHKCITLCKSGWSGDECQIHEVSSEPCNLAPTFGTGSGSFFVGQLSKLLTSGGEKYKITTEVDVFNQNNQFNTSNSREADVVLLGVVGHLEHGLKVAPVQIVAERSRTWDARVTSWIKSARSNGKTTILCAPGYIESNGDCVESTQCKTAEQTSQMCPGYSVDDYDATNHIIKTENNGCTYFRCLNYKGFKSENDKKTCVECEGGALAYIKDDGTCGKCTKGEIAKNTHDGCWKENEVTQYSREQMKSNDELQCWLETDARKFLGCVKGECSGTQPCWDKSHGCKACD